ncbi:hypothetical protein A3Q56_06392, partial [Intoshia linei]
MRRLIKNDARKLNTKAILLLKQKMNDGFFLKYIEIKKNTIVIILDLYCDINLYLRYMIRCSVSELFSGQSCNVMLFTDGTHEFIHHFHNYLRGEKLEFAETIQYHKTKINKILTNDSVMCLLSTINDNVLLSVKPTIIKLRQSVFVRGPEFITLNEHVNAEDSKCVNFAIIWKSVLNMDRWSWLNCFIDYHICVIITRDYDKKLKTYFHHVTVKLIECIQNYADFALIESEYYVKILKNVKDQTTFMIINIKQCTPFSIISLKFTLLCDEFMRIKVKNDIKILLAQLSSNSRSLCICMNTGSCHLCKNSTLKYISPDALKCSTLYASKLSICLPTSKPLDHLIYRYESIPKSIYEFISDCNVSDYYQKLCYFQQNAFSTFYHRRWFWSLLNSDNERLFPSISLEIILSSLCDLRIAEGFVTFHSIRGGIMMIRECRLEDSHNVCKKANSAIICYVLFPICSIYSQSPDRTNLKESESGILNEIWIEPFVGKLHKCERQLGELAYRDVVSYIYNTDKNNIIKLSTFLQHSKINYISDRKVTDRRKKKFSISSTVDDAIDATNESSKNKNVKMEKITASLEKLYQSSTPLILPNFAYNFGLTELDKYRQMSEFLVYITHFLSFCNDNQPISLSDQDFNIIRRVCIIKNKCCKFKSKFDENGDLNYTTDYFIQCKNIGNIKTPKLDGYIELDVVYNKHVCSLFRLQNPSFDKERNSVLYQSHDWIYETESLVRKHQDVGICNESLNESVCTDSFDSKISVYSQLNSEYLDEPDMKFDNRNDNNNVSTLSQHYMSHWDNFYLSFPKNDISLNELAKNIKFNAFIYSPYKSGCVILTIIPKNIEDWKKLNNILYESEFNTILPILVYSICLEIDYGILRDISHYFSKEEYIDVQSFLLYHQDLQHSTNQKESAEFDFINFIKTYLTSIDDIFNSAYAKCIIKNLYNGTLLTFNDIEFVFKMCHEPFQVSHIDIKELLLHSCAQIVEFNNSEFLKNFCDGYDVDNEFPMEQHWARKFTIKECTCDKKLKKTTTQLYEKIFDNFKKYLNNDQNIYYYVREKDYYDLSFLYESESQDLSYHTDQPIFFKQYFSFAYNNLILQDCGDVEIYNLPTCINEIVHLLNKCGHETSKYINLSHYNFFIKICFFTLNAPYMSIGIPPSNPCSMDNESVNNSLPNDNVSVVSTNSDRTENLSDHVFKVEALELFSDVKKKSCAIRPEEDLGRSQIYVRVRIKYFVGNEIITNLRLSVRFNLKLINQVIDFIQVNKTSKNCFCRKIKFQIPFDFNDCIMIIYNEIGLIDFGNYSFIQINQKYLVCVSNVSCYSNDAKSSQYTTGNNTPVLASDAEHDTNKKSPMNSSHEFYDITNESTENTYHKDFQFTADPDLLLNLSKLLPKFWLIIEIRDNSIFVHFHSRFRHEKAVIKKILDQLEKLPYKCAMTVLYMDLNTTKIIHPVLLYNDNDKIEKNLTKYLKDKNKLSGPSMGFNPLSRLVLENINYKCILMDQYIFNVPENLIELTNKGRTVLFSNIVNFMEKFSIRGHAELYIISDPKSNNHIIMNLTEVLCDKTLNFLVYSIEKPLNNFKEIFCEMIQTEINFIQLKKIALLLYHNCTLSFLDIQFINGSIKKPNNLFQSVFELPLICSFKLLDFSVFLKQNALLQWKNLQSVIRNFADSDTDTDKTVTNYADQDNVYESNLTDAFLYYTLAKAQGIVINIIFFEIFQAQNGKCVKMNLKNDESDENLKINFLQCINTIKKNIDDIKLIKNDDIKNKNFYIKISVIGRGEFNLKRINQKMELLVKNSYIDLMIESCVITPKIIIPDSQNLPVNSAFNVSAPPSPNRKKKKLILQSSHIEDLSASSNFPFTLGKENETVALYLDKCFSVGLNHVLIGVIDVISVAHKLPTPSVYYFHIHHDCIDALKLLFNEMEEICSNFCHNIFMSNVSNCKYFTKISKEFKNVNLDDCNYTFIGNFSTLPVLEDFDLKNEFDFDNALFMSIGSVKRNQFYILLYNKCNLKISLYNFSKKMENEIKKKIKLLMNWQKWRLLISKSIKNQILEKKSKINEIFEYCPTLEIAEELLFSIIKSKKPIIEICKMEKVANEIYKTSVGFDMIKWNWDDVKLNDINYLKNEAIQLKKDYDQILINFGLLYIECYKKTRNEYQKILTIKKLFKKLNKKETLNKLNFINHMDNFSSLAIMVSKQVENVLTLTCDMEYDECLKEYKLVCLQIFNLMLKYCQLEKICFDCGDYITVEDSTFFYFQRLVDNGIFITEICFIKNQVTLIVYGFRSTHLPECGQECEAFQNVSNLLFDNLNVLKALIYDYSLENCINELSHNDYPPKRLKLCFLSMIDGCSIWPANTHHLFVQTKITTKQNFRISLNNLFNYLTKYNRTLTINSTDVVEDGNKTSIVVFSCFLDSNRKFHTYSVILISELDNHNLCIYNIIIKRNIPDYNKKNNCKICENI